MANVLAPDPTFAESAQDDLYYLLGAEYIFTFVDDASWDESLPHPRHRPSGADKNAEPWPALLSGGPNAGRQDDAVKKLPQALPPAKDYVDDQASYASNEIAINWPAPLVFLPAGTLPRAE
ncbi:MAG TPA: glycoside hydrolase family 9 protein [Candidatus Acidoferrum sp.]|nr:glycoside hydrolase family 9 protein [Candidatus Acidoferrum sp.]